MARKSTVAAGIVVTAVTVAALIVAVLVTTEVDAWKNKVSQIALPFFFPFLFGAVVCLWLYGQIHPWSVMYLRGFMCDGDHYPCLHGLSRCEFF